MKAFRITWYSILDETLVFEGRSLIYSDDQENAAEKVYYKKPIEYKFLRPNSIIIESIIEMPHLNKVG